MDERHQQQKMRHRLAVLRHADEVTGNVAAACRYYGISRQTFYRWLGRYEEQGLRDGSSRPHNSPNATHTEIVGKIIYLRQNYHFGPSKISVYLERYLITEWWKELKARDRSELGARYTHAVSIETPGQHVDIWTPVAQQKSVYRSQSRCNRL